MKTKLGFQFSVTAKKCFVSTAFTSHMRGANTSYHHQSPVEGHLVEDEAGQQIGQRSQLQRQMQHCVQDQRQSGESLRKQCKVGVLCVQCRVY